MQLAENTDAMSAFGIDRNDGFEPDLKIAADPDYARIDRASGQGAIAIIIRDRRCERAVRRRL